MSEQDTPPWGRTQVSEQGTSPGGEDDGVGTGCVALGEDDGFCDESAWRVRNDLRAADPGANDGGGVGAERLGNSEDGSRWG